MANNRTATKVVVETKAGIRHALVMGILIVNCGLLAGLFMGGALMQFPLGDPHINSTVPEAGVNGDKIVITGENFGIGGQVAIRAPLNISPGYEDRLAKPFDWQNDKIEVFLPNFSNKLCRTPQSKIILELVVRRGQNLSNSINLDFNCSRAMIVDRIDPKVGLKGGEVMIYGRNFGQEQDNKVVFFGSEETGLSFAKALEWSNSKIKVMIPASAKQNFLGKVEVGVLESVKGYNMKKMGQTGDVEPNGGGDFIRATGRTGDSDPQGNGDFIRASGQVGWTDPGGGGFIRTSNTKSFEYE